MQRIISADFSEKPSWDLLIPNTDERAFMTFLREIIQFGDRPAARVICEKGNLAEQGTDNALRRQQFVQKYSGIYGA